MRKTESEQALPTPGQLLSSVRQEKEITIDTIAQNLRLEVSQIEALEADDYSKFPAIAYVRGYLRGYANQLGIEPEKVIQAFDQNTGREPSLEPFASQPTQQVGSGDKHMRVVTYSLIGVLVLLLGLWWKTHRSTPEIVDEQQAAVTAENNYQVPDVEILEGSTGELRLPEPIAPKLNKSIEVDEPQELKHEFAVVQFNELPKSPSSEFEETAIEASENEERVSEETITEEDKVEEVAAEVKPAVEEASPAEPVVTNNASNSSGIVLAFSGEAWIQISDASNKIVFSRTGQPGETVNIDGSQPFKLIVGKASVVDLRYQGQQVDLSPFTKNEVARFYLDENGARK